MDPPAREGWKTVPDGRRRDRNRFHRADRLPRHHSATGARVRLPGCSGSPQNREARKGREYLLNPVPLHPDKISSPKYVICPRSRYVKGSFSLRVLPFLRRKRGLSIFGDIARWVPCYSLPQVKNVGVKWLQR